MATIGRMKKMPLRRLVVGLALLWCGWALASPSAWFEEVVAGTRGMTMAECPPWAAGADACATSRSPMDGTMVHFFGPPAGYSEGDEWGDWAQLPPLCHAMSDDAWPEGCRTAMDYFGADDFVVVLDRGHALLYLDDPEIERAVADSRADQEARARRGGAERRARLDAARAGNLAGMAFEDKVRAFQREFFEEYGYRVIDCPASQDRFAFAVCGATHGDAEVFMATLDIYLTHAEWFDGGVVTEWRGAVPDVYKGLTIDGRTVTVAFEGLQGTYGDEGTIYVNFD